MEMVNIKINGMPLSVPAGSTILEAARMHGIEIPTLCYLREINEIGACRICVVEVVGMRNLVAACVYPVAEGMEILTNSKRVFASRKTNLELILSTHNRSCLSCVRSGNCELQKLCKDFRIYDEAIFDGEKPASDYDDSAVHMVRDNSKCVLCRRCAAACAKWQDVAVIGPNGRGFNTHIGTAFNQNLSTCKSPQQMFGALAKTWYAEKTGIDPKDIFVVGIMPCTAKKFETKREDESASGYPDVDVALTTRELARMIERAGMYLPKLPDEEFDAPLGTSTGAGVIFGATGGVMEAALRTAKEWITGESGEAVEFGEVRGTEGIKEASYKIGDLELNVCVASGLKNAKKVLESVKSGEKNYHFIEIMGCPGGCVNGGGQPVQPAAVRNFIDLKARRAAALYEDDKNKPIRKSHENPVVKEVYETYLGSYGSHKAHEILHTSYKKRNRF